VLHGWWTGGKACPTAGLTLQQSLVCRGGAAPGPHTATWQDVEHGHAVVHPEVMPRRVQARRLPARARTAAGKRGGEGVVGDGRGSRVRAREGWLRLQRQRTQGKQRCVRCVHLTLNPVSTTSSKLESVSPEGK
jgi:hypothetical protein